MLPVLTAIDVLTTAFVVGTTLWFFFIQAPVLLRRMGRERFVPVQMMATRALAKALLVGTGLMVVAAAAAGADELSISTAIVAFVGALVNERFIIPRALAAGGRGQLEVRGKNAEASTAGFAAEGVGASTSTLHRLVVLCVVVMLAGAIPHLLRLAKVI